MIIIEDVANKEGAHVSKNKYFTDNGIKVRRFGLPCCDYIIANEKVLDLIDRKETRGMTPHKMDFLGTYDVAVDTKMSMSEIESNIIGKSHARFRDECILAQNNGIKMYVLVENKDGIKTINDVFRYTSTRRLRWFKIHKAHENGKMLNFKIPDKPPVSGEQLAKAMLTMQLKYSVEFVFCDPNDAGAKVIELLTRQDTGNNPYQE